MTPRFSQRKCLALLLDPLFLVGAIITSGFLYFVHPQISALVEERSNGDNLIQDSDDIKPWNEKKDFLKLSLSMKNVAKNPITIFLEQDETWLIKFIRENYLHLPSELPYNLEQNMETLKNDPSFKKAQEVYTLLKEKINGTFVDYGAGDGEHHSATLTLELLYGWTGALIEASPNTVEKLMSKHRKTWVMSACITPFPFPKKMIVDMRTNAIVLKDESIFKSNHLKSVQCFPLYSTLLGLGMTKIDYLSMKSDGFELDILSTVPWNKVEIKVLSIDCKDTEYEKKAMITNFMVRHQYTEKSFNRNEYLIFINSKYLN